WRFPAEQTRPRGAPMPLQLYSGMESAAGGGLERHVRRAAVVEQGGNERVAAIQVVGLAKHFISLRALMTEIQHVTEHSEPVEIAGRLPHGRLEGRAVGP